MGRRSLVSHGGKRRGVHKKDYSPQPHRNQAPVSFEEQNPMVKP